MTEEQWLWRFSDNLSKQLKIRGFSQLEFANRMELSPQTVSRYFNGQRTPRISTLLQMCDVLGCGMEQLVC